MAVAPRTFVFEDVALADWNVEGLTSEETSVAKD